MITTATFTFQVALVTGLFTAITAEAGRTVKVTDFAQLVAACEGAVAGDEIVMAKGTYHITGRSRIAISHRPGPVTVRGETGNPADVAVEGAGQDVATVEIIFDLTDSPRWTFRDMTTRNSFYHGFKFNTASTDCVLRNVVMRDHGESGVKGTSDPAKGVYPDRLLVEGCDIGFTKETGGTRSVVEGINGVAVTGWVIRENRFINIQRNRQPAYGVFTKGNAQDTLIEGNRFEHCFIGASLGGGGTGAAYFRDQDASLEHRGGVIRKNTFIGCTDAAIYLNKVDGCRIEGNVMKDCRDNIQLRYLETRAHVRGNEASGNQMPLVRLRDGAVILE